MTIDFVLQEMKNKIVLSKGKSTSIKCRSFMKKLGYSKRSQKIIELVDRQIGKAGLQIELPPDAKNWGAIAVDDVLKFTLKVTPHLEIRTEVTRKMPTLFAFQAEAIHTLHRQLLQSSFRGLLVLPTGGGKTTTAVKWLYEAALLKGKRVLWIAHRHELLNQAFSTFQRFANGEREPIATRIISGVHEKAHSISKTDELIIASKDSLLSSSGRLEEWLEQCDELFVIVDEAHHATALTYRQLLSTIVKKVEKVHLLGLTATPFRTAETEQGALRALFKDGILYKKDLKNLIASGILSEPTFHELQTDVSFDSNLHDDSLKSIRYFDQLPEALASSLAQNKKRNHLIVQQYQQHEQLYGKTIIFAVNRAHATILAALFRKQHIDAQVVISSSDTDFSNAEIIEAFRKNEFPILINVNILTEGADFPDVQTVFLARPTTSSILMTQMIGRALRGQAAGGTKDAHIVSFIDQWADKIAWSNPQVLLAGENLAAPINESKQHQIATILSTKLLQEIALRIDDTVDFERLNRVLFEKSVPSGIFALNYIIQKDQQVFQLQEEVLVYENDLQNYEKMLLNLPRLVARYNLNSTSTYRELRPIINEIEIAYFLQDYFKPMYSPEDLVAIVKYYIETKSIPELLLFKERKQINITQIATEIIRENMTYSMQKQIIEKNWQENIFLQIFFSYKEYYYKKCIQTELLALDYIEEITVGDLTATSSLSKLKQENHTLWRNIVLTVFQMNRDEEGLYHCVKTGYCSGNKEDFTIAYRKSIKNGGLTTPQNLALIKRLKPSMGEH